MRLTVFFYAFLIGGIIVLVGTLIAFLLSLGGFALLLPLAIGSCLTMNTEGWIKSQQAASMRWKNRLLGTCVGLAILDVSLALFILALITNATQLSDDSLIGYFGVAGILSTFFRRGFAKSSSLALTKP